MNQYISITPLDFDKAVVNSLDYLNENVTHKISPETAISLLLDEVKNQLFSDDEGNDESDQDNYHSVKTFESTMATINVCMPDRMEWKDLPEEVRQTVTEISKGLIKLGESHDIKVN